MNTKRGDTTRLRRSHQPLLFPTHPTAQTGADILSLFLQSEHPGWPDAFGESLHESGLRPIRTLSLFSGGGGLDIGFHDAGFEILEAVEIDAKCVQVLRHNAQSGRVLAGTRVRDCDILTYTPDVAEKIEFLIGGPPCQSFSAAGRRVAGAPGINDNRGTLFEEFVRVLCAVKPRGFLFENVYGITGTNGGAAWQAIGRAFHKAGYTVAHRILDTADYGVPQHRERAIIVGFREGEFFFPRPTHGPDSPSGRPYYAAGTAITDAPSEPDAPTGVNGRYGHLLAGIPPGLNYSFYTERMGHPRPVFAWRSKFSDFLYKADPLSPIRTLKAMGGPYTGPFHWDGRPFSVGEFKRLQTIPDRYEFPVTRQKAVKMIGNSVPSQFARILALAVRAQIFGESSVLPVPLLSDDERLGFRTRKRLRTDHYRATADEAIRQAPTQRRTTSVARTYHASLRSGFAFGPDEGGSIRVQFTAPRTGWSVVVQVAADEPSHRITIAPVPGKTWALPTPRITLAFSPTEAGFTAAWKSLEAELIRGGYKADLVQLNGYFQYEPGIVAEAEFPADCDTNWSILALVSRGIGVSPTHLTRRRLATLWGVTEAVVSETTRWLKGLGYEVRNHNTNPEIPPKSYLIPYAFPTLTPQSVQLRKSLDRSE